MRLCAPDYTVWPDCFKTEVKAKSAEAQIYGSKPTFFLSIHLLHSQESENIKRDVKPPAEVVRACWNRPKLQQRASCSINTTSVHCGNSQRAESHKVHLPDLDRTTSKRFLHGKQKTNCSTVQSLFCHQN